MTNITKASSLKLRLEEQGRYSIVGKKPQGLTNGEIQTEVEKFLISQQAVLHSFAYGEGGEQFDPVKIFNSDKNQLENAKMWVDFEMADREAELLEEANSQQHSYNLLLFGVAMKVANDEKLSSPLQLFLLNHLICPPKPMKKSRGGVSKPDLEYKFRCFAILFATQHGVKPTRVDGGNPHSACDIVSDAAMALHRAGHEGFSTGYGDENLKKLWAKFEMVKY
jgi:hypothetical protein